MMKFFQTTFSRLRALLGPFGAVRFGLWELVLMRALFALVLWMNLTPKVPPGTLPHPYGFAKHFDFTFLAQPETYALCYHGALVLVVLFALGARGFWTLGPVFAFMIARASLNNSQGFIGHAGLVLALVVMAQVVASGAEWIGRRPRWWEILVSTKKEMQLAADWSRQAMIASYVVAGITKLVATEGEWLARAPYFLLQVCKVQGESWWGYGRSLGAGSEAFLRALGDHPWLAFLFLGAGLLLELFAFIALMGRRLGLVMGLSLLAFHLSLGWLMDLSFTTNQHLLMIFFINPVWWCAQLGVLVVALSRGRRSVNGDHS